MARVGIIGLGFMGKMHFNCYQALDGAELVAICDIDEKKFTDTSGTAGNIEGANKPLDLAGIELYTDFDEMLAKANLDAVSITLPTYMHRDYVLKALNAGVNTLCEKPMALEAKQCDEMIAAADKSGKILQIGHCIRFWPEYAKAKEIIDSGKYGKPRIATFQRLSLTPTWSWTNWLMDEAKSGGANLDLHIHDSDYVQYLFGMPKAVYSKGFNEAGKGYSHVVTQYSCDSDCVITAEGGWVMSPSFGFEMSFNIVLDKATITYDCTRKPAFKVCPVDGGAFSPDVEAGDGYSLEIAHFVKKVNGETVPDITTPKQSKNSVEIIFAEKQSADSGEKVFLV